MTILVVGARGLLGRTAAGAFELAGETVIRASHEAGGDAVIDLQRFPDCDALPSGITHALVCSSVTSVDACRRDPGATGRVNVLHTIALLRQLLDRGVRPIFCSSDLVFAGDRGGYTEDDRCVPTTEYGRQKRQVEEFLLAQRRPFLIVRMSKLYSIDPDDPSPVGQTLNSLARGEVVSAATDQMICPTAVSDIPRALQVLVAQGAQGVYHIATPERLTRYGLARRVAAAAGLESLVRPCSIGDFAFAEPRPHDSTLDVTRFLSVTDFVFTTLDASLPEILRCRRGGGLATRGSDPGTHATLLS